MQQKFEDYDIANKRFHESLNNKTNQLKQQSESDQLVKQLQVMNVEIDIHRAEPSQIFQALDGKQNEKLEKNIHIFLTDTENWD